MQALIRQKGRDFTVQVIRNGKLVTRATLHDTHVVEADAVASEMLAGVKAANGRK